MEVEGFRLVLAEPRILRDSLKVIKGLVSEAVIKVCEEGLMIDVMENANVCQINYELKDSSFVEYEVKPRDKSYRVGVSITGLYKELCKANKEDVLVLEYERGSNDMKITFKAKNVKTSIIKLWEAEDKELKKPEDFLVFNPKAEILMNSSELKKEFVFLKDYEEIFFVTGEKDLKKFFIMRSFDETEAKKEVLIEEKDDNKIIKEGDKQIVTKYSKEYLQKILEANILSDKVNIRYGNDSPLLVTYENKHRLRISFILAPRIDYSE